MRNRTLRHTLLCLATLGLWIPIPNLSADPQTRSAMPSRTTISALVKSSAKFNGKRVRIFASLHTDGLEHSVLMEPNCGQLNRTSGTSPEREPQCGRGVVPVDS